MLRPPRPQQRSATDRLGQCDHRRRRLREPALPLGERLRRQGPLEPLEALVEPCDQPLTPSTTLPLLRDEVPRQHERRHEDEHQRRRVVGQHEHRAADEQRREHAEQREGLAIVLGRRLRGRELQALVPWLDPGRTVERHRTGGRDHVVQHRPDRLDGEHRPPERHPDRCVHAQPRDDPTVDLDAVRGPQVHELRTLRHVEARVPLGDERVGQAHRRARGTAHRPRPLGQLDVQAGVRAFDHPHDDARCPPPQTGLRPVRPDADHGDDRPGPDPRVTDRRVRRQHDRPLLARQPRLQRQPAARRPAGPGPRTTGAAPRVEAGDRLRHVSHRRRRVRRHHDVVVGALRAHQGELEPHTSSLPGPARAYGATGVPRGRLWTTLDGDGDELRGLARGRGHPWLGRVGRDQPTSTTGRPCDQPPPNAPTMRTSPFSAPKRGVSACSAQWRAWDRTRGHPTTQRGPGG